MFANFDENVHVIDAEILQLKNIWNSWNAVLIKGVVEVAVEAI